MNCKHFYSLLEYLDYCKYVSVFSIKDSSSSCNVSSDVAKGASTYWGKIMRKFLNLSVSIVFVAVMAGCGSSSSSTEKVSDDSESTSYPAAIQSTFLKSCVANAALSGGGEEADYEDICGCALDEIQARFTLEEFTAAEEAMASGEASNIDMEAIGKLCAD